MQASDAAGVDIGYALPNDWELGRERLELLEACYDPTTIRIADTLGVARGWRCLDAGAGSGSFPRWLASRVRAEGAVVAADLDVSLLDGAPGLEVRRIDLERDELPQEEFDLVHTRLVLMHLPTRDEVLRRLAAAVRPGGVLMIEEDDVHPVMATAGGAYLEAWRAFAVTMRRAGTDPEWARALPERLGALGLVDIGAEVSGQLFRGGSDWARFWSLTWLQLRSRIVARGTPAKVIDDGRSALEDESRWFHGSETVIVWGRRPAARR